MNRKQNKECYYKNSCIKYTDIHFSIKLWKAETSFSLLFPVKTKILSIIETCNSILRNASPHISFTYLKDFFTMLIGAQVMSPLNILGKTLNLKRRTVEFKTNYFNPGNLHLGFEHR